MKNFKKGMEKPTPDALVSSPYFSSSPNSYIPSDNQGKEEFSVGIPSLAERPPPIPITNPMLRQTGPRPAIHDVKEYQQQITQESKGKQKYKRANSKFSSIKDQAVNNFAISPTSLTTTFQATSPISSKLSRRDYRAILSDTNLSSSKIFEESEVMNGTITPAPMVIKSYAPRNSGPITPLNDPIEFDSIPTRSTWASRGGETSFISPTTFTRTQFHPTIFKPDILNINRSKYVPISYSHPSVIPFSSNGSLPKSPKSLEKKKKLRPQISSETSQFYASCDPAIFRPTIIRSVQAKNNNSHIQISSGSDTDHISQTLECPSVGKPTESRRSSLDDFLNSRKNTLDDFQFSCEPSASQSTKSQKNSKVLETDSDIDPDFHPSFKDLCARRSSRRLASIQSTTASQSNPFYDGSEDLLFTNEFSVDTLKHKNYRELFYYPIHEFQGDSSSAAEAGVEVPQHRILIRQEELDRIEPRQYLNDTLIDFYYKYLEQAFVEESSRNYFFNSYFYKVLTRRGHITEDNYARLRKWTKFTDIFSKSLIFIPINEYLHWYLAIVYNPAVLLLLPTIKDSIPIESSHGISSSQNHSGSQSPSDSKSVEESCYIWILDSLGGKHKSMTIRAIKRYLYLEAQDKFPEIMQHIDLPLFESRIKATYPNVPFQRNSTDCGLYVLQYTEMLVLKSPPLILNYLATKQDLKGWFSHEDISGRREKIKNILLKLTDDYRKVMGIDPLDQPSLIENPNLSDGSSSPIQMYDFNPDLLE